MALILSFDTATKHCAVVLADGGIPVASRVEDSGRYSHAEKLNVFIAEILEEAGRTTKDLAAVAVGIGPGSYTGLRIGLSAAKGLCFALDVPLIALGTLDVLVREACASGLEMGTTDALYPMIDARRMEVFAKEFDAELQAHGTSRPLLLDDDWCMALDPDRRHIVLGDGADKASELWARHAHIMHVVGVRPSVRGLSEAADLAFQQNAFADLSYLVPDYGKDANVTQPGKRGVQ